MFDKTPMRKSEIQYTVCDSIQFHHITSYTAGQVRGTNTGAGVWFNDGNGHGTHCSGTIGAVGNNSVGVVGIRERPSINIFHAGKGLADDGSGLSSNVMAAVQGCVENGAK